MQMEAFLACRAPKGQHQTTWGRFNRYLAEASHGMHNDGGVGIWHEAYLVSQLLCDHATSGPDAALKDTHLLQCTSNDVMAAVDLAEFDCVCLQCTFQHLM